MVRPLTLRIVPLSLILLQAGCGSSDSAPQQQPAADAGLEVESGSAEAETDAVSAEAEAEAAAADADADASSATLSVGVYDTIHGEPAPVSGAAVEFQQAGNLLGEAVTDSSGLVSFSAPDWSKGPIVLAAMAKGYATRSLVGVTPATLKAYHAALGPKQSNLPEAVVFLSPLLTSELFANVSGALPPLESGHFAVVTPTILGSSFQNVGASYSLRVAKNTPFSLIAVDALAQAAQPREILQAFSGYRQIDVPPIEGDTEADFGVNAVELTPTTLTTSLLIPGGDSGPLGTNTTGYLWISSVESLATAFLGAATHCRPSKDLSRFDCDVSYVTPQGQAQHFLTLGSILLADGGEARATFTGIPAAGAELSGFQVPIPVTVTEQSLQDPIATLAVPEGTSYVTLSLQGVSGYWQITNIDTSAAAFKAPVPPKGLLEDLGDSMTGRLQCAGPPDPETGFRKWATTTRTFTVVP